MKDPLRGDTDSGKISLYSPEDGEGKLKRLIRFLASHDDKMKLAIEKCPDNATYMSADIQNQFINLVASDILDGVIKKIKKASVISVMADEASRFLKDYLSIAIRYVDVDEHRVKVRI
jgi:hypothetical protein